MLIPHTQGAMRCTLIHRRISELVESWTGRRVETAKGSLWPHKCTTSLAPEAQPSTWTSWSCFVAHGPVCLDSPCAQSCEKCFSVDVPTQLRNAVAHSSMSLTTEIAVDLWKRQRNVQGVFGVHVDDLVGGGNLTFQKAVQWLLTELEFGTWDQSRFRFRGR